MPHHSHFGSNSVGLPSGLKSVWLLASSARPLTQRLCFFVAHWWAAQSFASGEAALLLQAKESECLFVGGPRKATKIVGCCAVELLKHISKGILTLDSSSDSHW